MRPSTVGVRIGRYEVGERIGKGGFGVVHLAHDNELGREVAIKFLRPEFMTRTQVVQRFIQEARACAKIGHNGIVTVFEAGIVEGTGQRLDGTAYIVMERLRGESLGQRIAARGKLPPIAAIGIARQLASALQVAHDAGIIHRDLKPDNVYLVKDAAVVGGERVKILDFGVAKLRDPDPEENPNTHSQMMLGTPRYMSPEQARAAAKVDHRTDIYALGCLLYELVCGKPPFTGDIGDVLVAHQTQPITPPREIVPSIPAALDELIVRMLAKDPDARPQSMRLVDSALDAVFTSLAPKQRAKTAPEEANTTPHVPLGPTTDEPTFRLRPSHDADTAQDLEDDFHTTKPARLPPRVVTEARFEPTEPMRSPSVSPWWRWRFAIGIGAAVLSCVVMYLVLRKEARRDEAPPAPRVVVVDAAMPPPDAVIAKFDDTTKLTASCTAAQADQNWLELEDCGRELAKLSPADGKAFVDRASAEARTEVKVRTLLEAIKSGDFEHASALVDEIPETSVYSAAARKAYDEAKGPLIDHMIGDLNAIRDCAVHAAKLHGIESKYGAKIARQARLTARPCALEKAEGLPTPLEACDRETVDAENRRGEDALSTSNFAVALTAFERVAKCRPEVKSKAYLAACRTRNFPKAKRLFDAIGKPTLAQICIREGYDPR